MRRSVCANLGRKRHGHSVPKPPAQPRIMSSRAHGAFSALSGMAPQDRGVIDSLYQTAPFHRRQASRLYGTAGRRRC